MTPSNPPILNTVKPPVQLRTPDWYRARLALPQGCCQVVIDTDAANEIDDQFALAWALLSPQQLDIKGIYAAPFSFAHRRAMYPNAPGDAGPFNPPATGMQRSYDEIITVYDKLGLPSQGQVWRGSAGYLPAPQTPLHSDAAHHLVATARACPADQPLYVLALGCVTNVVSALLLAPDIADKLVVVWTSAFPSHAPHANRSFNLEQDVYASQALYACGVPLVYLPGYHVGAQLRLSLAEAERYVRGQGAMGDYLHGLFTHNPLWPMLGTNGEGPHSWVIWDLINIAWMLQPAWVPSELVATPRLDDQLYWQADPQRPLMREAYGVQRDAIFNDLFAKLAHHAFNT